jgi:hypothetical protein
MYLFGGMLKPIALPVISARFRQAGPQEYSATSLTVTHCGIEEMMCAGV